MPIRPQRFILLLLILLGTVALGGCPEETPADGDGGFRDARIRLDGRVDAAPGVDASLTCGAQDLLDQFLCGAGRKCTLTDGTSTVGCAEAGASPHYGGCDATFPDGCEVGSLCSNAGGAYQCLPFCGQPGSYCEGGRCGDDAVATSGAVSVYVCLPADGCNALTTDPAQSGCGAGAACYLAAVGNGLTFCEPQGTASEGEPCANDFACVQGYSCFGPAGDGECRKICRANTDADCPGSQTCGPLNDQYGICFGF